MPFIKPELRQPLLDQQIMPEQVGDLCFLAYKPMVDKWTAKPSWTTAHHIYKDLHKTSTLGHLNNSNAFCAAELAWQVFFIKYVWPYELDQIAENGDII